MQFEKKLITRTAKKDNHIEEEKNIDRVYMKKELSGESSNKKNLMKKQSSYLSDNEDETLQVR